ncbi:efflux RND transporter periplasmic adaptor subunit [Algoriphagus sp.]|jgi:Cu(I)/Ag(I) efflux system membrane fusion protein|uniref:efflux RND transporter periplasmic adaptor subunit n=1 Tax=Algoriphagus sp. TaxID=1872435 RepID=UPI0027248AF8|nr:efflux RND transporter periplasmic adaptor subunit [Algoriphagus sp.]MDO8965025.1 efflux RND transporter periplasmic adaptor subunit [Algoriphagus sp.]MDP3201261.1 efflux RND transporter periplasmic adaptor subunit [Algoriphagus sp.]
MKKIFENKFALITLTLVIGVLFGWLIKPSPSQLEATDGHDHGLESLSNQLWTCSMHPQVKLSEPGDCPLCGMDLIPVSTSSSSSSNPMAYEMTPEAVAMAQIHTTKIAGVNASGELFLTGKIQPDERENASVTAKYPGRIERLFVSFTGEEVKAGQRLATLYSPELLSAQRELLEAVKSKNDFPELYQAAKEKLKFWKLTESQINAIEQSGKVTEQIDILADQSGVVVQRNVAVGDYVSTGTVLFNVVNLNKLWVLLDAYESDLQFLNFGNEINFSVAGFPGDEFKAKITFIDRLINPNTRAASVRAEITNSGQKLKPEMFVTARIRTNAKSAASGISVPRTAVLWSGKRSVIYVKVPDAEMPSFEMREVTLGPRMGDNYIIEAGLQAGEEIVTNGVFAIDAAAQLSGQFSMMNRPKTKSLEVSQEFRDQITSVADAYFLVKNNLVKDNLSEAQKSLSTLDQNLGKVNMNLVKGEAHDLWMGMLSGLKDAKTKMANTKDLEEARKHFSMLSFHMLEVTETFGLNKAVVYKDYCPMAFGDQGAYWLSEQKEITNPYFGASMLSCGEVKQTYLKGQPVMNLAGNPTSPPVSHNH